MITYSGFSNRSTEEAYETILKSPAFTVQVVQLTSAKDFKDDVTGYLISRGFDNMHQSEINWSELFNFFYYNRLGDLNHETK
jgi:hypothetical protein